MTGNSGSALDRELRVFEQNKDTWLREGKRGKFALIHDAHVAGVFDTREAGVVQGYQRFGNVPFLVREIREQQRAMMARPFGLKPS